MFITSLHRYTVLRYLEDAVDLCHASLCTCKDAVNVNRDDRDIIDASKIFFMHKSIWGVHNFNVNKFPILVQLDLRSIPVTIELPDL